MLLPLLLPFPRFSIDMSCTQVVASASSAEEQFKEVLKSKSDMIAAAKVGASDLL